jgi:hypothetical protein
VEKLIRDNKLNKLLSVLFAPKKLVIERHSPKPNLGRVGVDYSTLANVFK